MTKRSKTGVEGRGERAAEWQYSQAATLARNWLFFASAIRAILLFEKALHMQQIDQFEQMDQEIPKEPSPRAADWFWRPWYAKVTWALTLVYWIGLEGMLAVPFDRLNIYLVNTMVLLIFVFNPITVVAVLGYGFLKAKVACGEWVITPGPPPQRPILDPYTDPTDPRSGLRHLKHIGAIKD